MTGRSRGKRGVILTSEGWDKLNNAKQVQESQENSVKPYTIESLSEITRLDPTTISKVLRREVGVDKRTLDRFFRSFGLELNQSDYTKLDVVNNKVEKPRDNKRNNYFCDEAPDVSIFYGRTEELNILKQWVVDDGCRLITLIGIGGIGKTTLSAKVTKNLSQYFDYSIWFSLRNLPPLLEIITNLLQILSNGEETDLGKNITLIINKLIGYLKNRRCLLIMDNVDAIFSDGNYAGNYLEGYEDYGEFFRKLGEVNHQSCLLITSREKPKEIAAIEGKELPVRSLQISGLGISEIKEIFKAKGIVDTRDLELKQLINNYGGNPLYLKVIATTILDLFDGNVDDFLAQSTTVFGDICNLINRQFQHLSQLEKSVLYWLAINRDAVAITELKNDLLSPKFERGNESSLELRSINQFSLLEILDSLHRRSLIEKTRDDIHNSSKFSLQPVVMEYVTINLIERISHEIICGEILLFQSHALLKATALDYIQEIQKRLIITPIIERLEMTLGSKEEIESYLMKMLDRFRKKSPSFTGYVGGNILNILSSLSVKISDKDFSDLSICQGNLQGITFNNVSFTNSNFAKTTFTDTFGIIFSLAFSPSGEFLVTGSIDGEVCLWKWEENRQIFKHQEHTTIIDSITFSPDNQKIASSSRDRNIKIWDIATGKCIDTLNSPDNQTVKKIVFNLDGSQLFGYSEKQIISWNLETGNSDILIESESRISALSLSPQTGLLIFGCENGVVYLWDINTKTVINSFNTNSGVILSVKIIDSNQILASSLENKTVKIWDVHNCKCLNIFKSQSYHISLIDISINGENLATGSGEKIVKVWNIQTGLFLQSLEGHLSEINAITFSSKNILATASVDRTVKIWDITTGKCLKTLQGRADFVHSVVFTNKSQIIVSGSQHTIKFWDINTNQCLSTFFEHKDWLSSLIISPDEKFIACANVGNRNNIIRVWQIDSLTKNNIQEITNHQISHKILQGHNDSIWSIAFSQDSTKIVSGSSDRTVKIWSSQTGECLKTFYGHTRPILSVAFSSDGKTIASCGGHSIIKFWDIVTGECKGTIQEKASYIIRFNFNGLILISGQTTGIVKLWDVVTGECIDTLGKFGKPIISMACSYDGKFIAYGTYDGIVNIWDVKNSQLIEILQEKFSSIWSLAFSSDSNFLVIGRDRESFQVWDINAGKIINSFQGDRPYENIDISGVTGLSNSTITNLKELGAYNCKHSAFSY
ncbi:WD40 repeat domain-containing protein [Okeania sp. SIO1I7]|uniref:WD40 repeat domain-containing protein n=1 Tax=Okeania sp. SIO1I7 TaxID=2607772 RepID=UPI0013FC3CA2|nr:WD40 repeat domain-containing protein [Okeania sp. SIO1I7]NET24944.1 hypothetical protein [Okeania sp. SIO1I7]